MSGSQTEGALRCWRYGQTQAERLAAAVLHIEGYEDVDPQHPLGGPDGLKDVLCRKDSVLWVAAAYLPTTQVSFTDIRNKFDDDVMGAPRNGARGFAFFINQPLTVAQRSELIRRSRAEQTEIYHLERLVGILNAPKGCGARLEHLRIAMSEEEQWSFWSTMNADIVRRLADNEARREARLDTIDEKLNLILKRTTALDANLRALPSSLVASPVIASIELPTASLSVSVLCWLHRLLTEGVGLPEAVRGRLRAVQVWVGGVGPTRSPEDYTPPPPEEILDRTTRLIAWWQRRHQEIRAADKPTISRALAEFHHRFLQIHPFLDANGRVARALLDQAARELLNQGIGTGFVTPPSEYYNALKSADEGDLEPLTSRVAASLQ
jgi:fido (protein-threonine AMPylation protein)